MTRARRITATAALAVVAATAAVGARHWAILHARHFSGTEPRTLNCYTCHVTGTGGGLVDRFMPPTYRSPLAVAVSPDDRTLYITAEGSDSLLVVDAASRRMTAEIPVGKRPHGVALSHDGTTAYVTNERGDSVSVVDLARGHVGRTFAAGHQPAGITLAADGASLFVASRGSDQVIVLDAADGREIVRLAAGSAPAEMGLGPDGARLVVGNELSFVGRPGQPPASEVTVIDPLTRRVVGRPALVNAHLSAGVAVTPDGTLALVALVQPKNLVPIVQVARGWVMTNGLGVVDLRAGTVSQLVLDDTTRSYADPYGVAITPDGRRAFVTHSGADVVSVVDVQRLQDVLAGILPGNAEYAARDLSLASRFVMARVPTAANPKGIAISHDGRYAYVAERLADSVLVLDTRTLQPAGRIPLATTTRETTLRRGERLFNSAAATFQGQFSCRSCHPNDHVDRLQYDFEPDGLGKDIVDNRSLLGIAHTAPFKWNGKNTSTFMQCGIRFARILTRLEPFPPGDLAALVAFMRSLTPVANPYRASGGTLTPSQQHGQQLYVREAMKDGTPIPAGNRCATCHPGPLFTNRHLADVGTRSRDSSIVAFDTPHLTNVYDSAPYLHDGRARSLEEIWTVYNPEDKHGVTRDMSKRDLNDLIDYLKTL